MFDVPDPAWKANPDIVANESFRARYEWGPAEEEEEETEDD